MRISGKTLQSVRNLVATTYDGLCDVESPTSTDTPYGKDDSYAIRLANLPCRLEPIRSRELLNDADVARDWLRFFLFVPPVSSIVVTIDNPKGTVQIFNKDRVTIKDKDNTVLVSEMEVQNTTSFATGNRFEVKAMVTKRQTK
jgi:hypothetical protein